MPNPVINRRVGGKFTCPKLAVGGLFYSDTFESYSNGAAVNGLAGGTGWCKISSYVDSNNYLGLGGLDTMESYSNGALLEGLNGGTTGPTDHMNFLSGYVADNLFITIADKQWFTAGATAHITVATVNGNSPFVYQWQKNGVNLTDTGNITGSTTATLVISNYQAANDDATYTVSVTDASVRPAVVSGGCVTAIGTTAGHTWSERVSNNITPGLMSATVSAADTFSTSVSGISSHLFHVNLIASENLIAALTPFINTVGNSLWTKHTLGTPPTESITVNGLKAATNDTNGTIYDMGFAPSGVGSFTTGNGGITAYVSDAAPPSSNNDLAGCYNGTNDAFGVQAFNGANALALVWQTAHFVNVPHSDIGGFYSINRTATNSLTYYFASSAHAFASIGTDTNSNAVSPNSQNVGACGEIQPSSVFKANAGRLSFVAVHDGLSSSDCQTLYNAVQAFRTATGGGFV